MITRNGSATLKSDLKLMDKGPENSPYFLFTKSVIHFQWAAVRIKFGYNWDAGWQLRRAYLQIKENMRLISLIYTQPGVQRSHAGGSWNDSRWI